MRSRRSRKNSKLRNSARRPWVRAKSTIACATGASRVSAIGAARSRSSIATIAASFRCPPRISPSNFPRTRRSTSRAIRSIATQRGSTSIARSAERKPGARRTPWTRSSTAHGTTCASPRRTPKRPSMPRQRPTGCPSTSTSAASSTRFCTCSIRASSIAPWPIPGTSPRTRASRSARSSRKAW